MSALRVRWPFWVALPASSAFFWLAYVFVLPRVSRRLIPRTYASFNEFNERCWRQNLNSLLHTTFAAPALTYVLLSDGPLRATGARLMPAESLLLYLDIALSLGYFSFALPQARSPASACAFIAVDGVHPGR